MSLAHAPDGTSGPVGPVVVKCARLCLNKSASFIIFSNRWMSNGTNLARVMKQLAVSLGVSANRVVLPDDPEDTAIRNTLAEAEFAISVCKKNGWRTLTVVANHLHMRRVLASFHEVLAREDASVLVYWMSVGRDSYGKGVSSQKRFDHPLWFLVYEYVAYLYTVTFLKEKA